MMKMHVDVDCKQRNAHACVKIPHECASKTEMEEKKLLNKVIIFVFYAHKKYYHSFIILRLNH